MAAIFNQLLGDISPDIDQHHWNVTPYFIHIDMAPDDRGMGIRDEWIIVCDPIILPKSRSLLTQSTTGEPHPLINTASFDLLFCRLSGNQLRVREYQSQLQKLSWHRGEVLRSSSILPTSTSGCSFVLQDKLILCKWMWLALLNF